MKKKDVDYRKLKIRGGNRVDYDFSDYKTFKELFRDLYYKKITIVEVEVKQYEFDTIINSLENYNPRNNKYVEAKNKLLNNVKKNYEGREKITEGFKNEVFPVYYDKEYEYRMKFERQEEEREEEEIKNIRDENGLIDYGKLMRKIGVKERKINRELVKKYFFNDDLGNLLQNFKKSKNNFKRNNIQVNVINSGLKSLKEKITNMSEKEKKNRKTK